MDPVITPPRTDENVPDVFNMDMECEQASEATNTAAPDPGSPAAPAATAPSSRVRPGHFILASALAAIVWVGWPALNRPTATGMSAGAGPTKGEPDRMPAPAAIAALPGPRQIPVASPPVSSSATPADFAASPKLATVEAQILREQADQATAMIAAIDSVAARLTGVEARLSAMSQTHSARGNTTASIERSKPAGTRQRPPRPKTQEPTGTRWAPAAFQLNTIFRDQAWIDYEDSIHVVQPGDRLGELTIVRIDAGTRQVHTTAGVIR